MKNYHYLEDSLMRLEEVSIMMFEEVSSGVYYVKKDRTCRYGGYITADEVISSLNFRDKVSVVNANGISANFDLSELL